MKARARGEFSAMPSSAGAEVTREVVTGVPSRCIDAVASTTESL
jgi:hypothetical protein